MRKTLAGALTLLVGVTGCSCLRPFAGAQPFDPKNPKVYVVESPDRKTKSIVVDQEPIYFFRSQGSKIPIRWQLQTSGYKFDATQGIDDIQALKGASGQVHSCRVEAGSKDDAFGCIFENTAQQVVYKYRINVIATDGSGNPPPLDPSIAND
ncbi:MAG TPA: hypothetical protein VFA72_00375 [Burkholderiales bacterium]|nr:hypothetical protein [Burkholderiales bacterium]